MILAFHIIERMHVSHSNLFSLQNLGSADMEGGAISCICPRFFINIKSVLFKPLLCGMRFYQTVEVQHAREGPLGWIRVELGTVLVDPDPASRGLGIQQLQGSQRAGKQAEIELCHEFLV
jgi:hypothetical protein